MFNKEFDVFIAYHGSYEQNGPRSIADSFYSFLVGKGLNVFYFPKSGRDTYKANIIDVMKSRVFLLICNDTLNKVDNLKIDQSKHYELSTEIDAFYALTQFGNDVTVQDSKILVCGNYSGKEGAEAKLHELFANRTHFFHDETNAQRSFDEVYAWIIERLEGRKNKDTWQSSQTTNEVKEVFARRSSMGQKINLSQLVASAKSVKSIGISNSELTIKIDIEAVKFALNRDASFELVFLDPDGDFTGQREKEEGLRPNRIKNITNQNIESALDLKYSLPDEQKSRYRLFKYNAQPRMNMIIVDNHIILQYYANSTAGLSNPCFLLERQQDNSPLYDFCMATYEELTKNAVEIEE